VARSGGIAKQHDHVPIGIELEEAPKRPSMVGDAAVERGMCAQRAPRRCPDAATWRSSADQRSSFISGELKDICSAMRFRGGARRSGRARGLIARVMCQRIAFANERRADGRIAGISAIPITLTVDLD